MNSDMNYSEDELELYAKVKDYGKTTGNGDTLYDMTVEIPVKVWITVEAADEHEAVVAATDALTGILSGADDIDDYNEIDGMKASVVETRRA